VLTFETDARAAAEPKEWTIELLKKNGKGIGLALVGKKDGGGVFVSDIVSEIGHLHPKTNNVVINLLQPYSYFIVTHLLH